MNPGAFSLSSIPPGRYSGTWYRAVQTRFLATALSTAHTATVASRFSDGTRGCELLYVAEDHVTALFEVQALLGTPWSPGGIVPVPGPSWVLVPVQADLRKVADLTSTTTQTAISTSTQEITGDWRGYALRSLLASGALSHLAGAAPTQQLGAFLCDNHYDGVLTVSARVPYRRSLVILPKNLSASGGSFEYTDPITGDRKMVP